MRILVACEMSGRVRDAFIRQGHDAWSCDTLPTLVPGPHIQGDVRPVLRKSWDMVIAFPPCTHLAVSGAHLFEQKRLDGRQQDGIDFFMTFPGSAPMVCIENPVGIMSSLWRPPDQIIQPWQFGEDASKKTCLWLEGLNPLKHERIIPPRGWMVWEGQENKSFRFLRTGGHLFFPLSVPPVKPVWGNQTPSGQNKLGPSKDRAMLRSLTYQGIADAMARQWSSPPIQMSLFDGGQNV